MSERGNHSVTTDVAAPTTLGRDFWKLWGSSSVSNLGDGVHLTAITLLAVSITTDPFQLSAVSVAATLPWLLFSLFGGVLVDRWDRRRTMWITDSLRLGLAAVLALLVATGQATIWALVVTTFLLVTGETLYGTAAQSIIPQIVSRAPSRLQRANSRIMSSQIVLSEFAGRPLGGALFQLFAWLPMAFNALSFGIAAVLIARIRPSAQAPREHGGVLAEIGEGLRWLWRHRLLRTIALAVTVGNFAFLMWNTVLALVLVETLHVTGAWFGVLTACMGLGGLVGSLGVVRISDRAGLAATMIGAMLLEGAATTALGLYPGRVTAVVTLFLIGAAAIGWNVVTVSLRQSLIPEHLQGRVNGAYRLLAAAGAPVGALLGGLIASRWGLSVPFVVGGCVIMSFSMVAASTVINRHNVEAAQAAAG